MRIHLLLLSFLLMGPLMAQPPGNDVDRTDAQGRKQGTWSKTWPSTGKTRYMGQFKDDKPYGLFRHYDEDGNLATEQTWAADGVTSRAVHYRPNGQVMARGKYVGQQKDSTWTYFDEDGHQQGIERYTKGVLEGEKTEYYASGQVAQQTIYLHGKQHGPWKQYFAGGQMKAQANYVNGEPDGLMTWWYPSGKKEIEGRMVNGARDGDWTYYNEDASVQIVMSYAQGEFRSSTKMNGVFKEYYDDEQLKEEVTWKNGKREGPFTEYNDDGHWVRRAVPADPNLGTGPDNEQVLEDQTRKRSGTYKNDLLEGAVQLYDAGGRASKQETYVKGELVPNGTKP